jgi:hypothetical protein
MRRPLSEVDYKLERAISGWIALACLVVVAFTGSWVAAFLAVAFGVVDTSISRLTEVLDHALSNRGES